MTLAYAQNITGLPRNGLLWIAQEREFVFAEETVQLIGLEHLPCLPSDATVHRWKGGTTYRIPATDSPGYNSLVIHTRKTRKDDETDE